MKRKFNHVFCAFSSFVIIVHRKYFRSLRQINFNIALKNIKGNQEQGQPVAVQAPQNFLTIFTQKRICISHTQAKK